MKLWTILALAPLAIAQQQHDVLIHRAGPMQATQVFTAASSPVKGAPYAAETISETVQRLGDGTRIANTSTSRLFRDSEGRTRTDATLKPLGPWVAEGGGSARAISTIFDPVTQESITLHHDTKTANRSNLRQALRHELRSDIEKKVRQEVRVEIDRKIVIAGPGPGPSGAASAPPPPDVIHFVQEGLGPGPVATQFFFGEKSGAARKDLGRRVIEGLECEGALMTVTIPEGQVGNDRPIEITTETWRSPELRIEVLRKHNDPRYGETTYRVVNLVRAEQPRSLFEVPPGYETKEGPAKFDIRVDRPKP
ncbi:MAG: hypothetical protein KJZ84_05275 [Bryobacteraceae bacterium]|nr:hypothetical protein [Bryobacteraceae bacterium]